MAIPIGAYSSNASLAAKERAEDVMSGKAHYEANGSCKIRPTSSRSKSVRRACIEASKADVRERTQQLSLNATMEDSRPRDGADDDVADALRSGVGGGGGNDKVLHAESRGGGGAGGGSWHPFRPRRLPRSPGANRSAPPWIFPSRAFARCSVSPRSNATTISVSWSPMARTGPWPTNSSWIASASASRALHFRHAVRRFTAGRWLVLVGDSSMRMLYHHLVNTLLGRWTSWPVAGTNNHFEAGSCFDLPNFTWTYTQPDDCIEDYQLDGGAPPLKRAARARRALSSSVQRALVAATSETRMPSSCLERLLTPFFCPVSYFCAWRDHERSCSLALAQPASPWSGAASATLPAWRPSAV